ncbi:MAG: coproporphyrinogen III oxidase, partial [Proteobacteria bacterium]|nr:coproporphyrinogen III oxidase [Pseudomonadota bacterium]
DDRLRRAVIEKLMCDLEADLGALAVQYGLRETFAPELEALKPMAADGLLTVTENRIRITEEGRSLMRTVAAVFDRYLKTGAAKHSRAV